MSQVFVQLVVAATFRISDRFKVVIRKSRHGKAVGNF